MPMELKDCLKQQMLKVGAPNFDKEAAEFMVSWLAKNFKHLTTQQIDEAFDYAIMGKTMEAKDAKCFQFNCQYVSMILSAYQRYMKDAGKWVSTYDAARAYKPLPEGPMGELSEETKRIVEEGKKRLEEWIKRHTFNR